MEGANYVDQVCHCCDESAELGEAFKTLRVHHISGNMRETCHHLGTYLRVRDRVDEVVSLLRLRWVQGCFLKKG